MTASAIWSLSAALCIVTPVTADAAPGLPIQEQDDVQKAVAQTPAARAQSLLDEIQSIAGDIDELRVRAAELTGEDSALVQQRIERRIDEVRELAEAFILAVTEADVESEQVKALVQTASRLLDEGAARYRAQFVAQEQALARLRSARDTLTGAELLELEERIADEDELLDRVIARYLEGRGYYRPLGLDPESEYVYLDSLLTARAQDTAERIRLTVAARGQVRSKIREASEEEAQSLAVEMRALDERLAGNAASLSAVATLMEQRDLDASDYRRLLVTATGELTTDILDTRVALGLVQQGLAASRDWIATRGVELIFKLFAFVVIFALFWGISRIARRVVQRALSHSRLHFSKLLSDTIVSLTGKVVVLLGILIGLSQIGFQLGPLLAGLGVVGFIVGFALQDTLGNFASGFMIVIYRPFDVGDVVEAGGVFGKVDAMTMVSTAILTFDNQRMIVPNRKIWGEVIRNVTSEEVRRVDLSFGISYSDDIGQAERILKRLVSEHPLVLEEPEPLIKVHELGDSAINFVVRPWCKTEDYWTVYWDLTRSVKMTFDAEGVSIPFPQRDVHVYAGAPGSGNRGPSVAADESRDPPPPVSEEARRTRSEPSDGEGDS